MEKGKRDLRECSFYKSLLSSDPKSNYYHHGSVGGGHGSSSSVVGRSSKKGSAVAAAAGGSAGVSSSSSASSSSSNVGVQALSNEELRRACSRTIAQFLAYSGFPAQLTPRQLFAAPPRNVLLDIWNHLLRRAYDDSVSITPENANEEVPRLFKELGYPLTIAKSSMQAPNSGHQWPLHVHALEWLCELLIYESEVFSRTPALAPPGVHTPPVAAAFEDLLPGTSADDVVCQIAVEQYAQTLQTRDVAALQENAEIRLRKDVQIMEAAAATRAEQLAVATQETQDVTAELEANAALLPEINHLTSECQKLQEAVQQQRIAIIQVEKAIAAKEEEKKNLQTELQAVAAEAQLLEQRVRAQGMSRAEMEKIKTETACLREGVSLRSKEIDTQQQLLARLEEQKNQHAEELRVTTRSCNALLQHCTQHAENVKFDSQPGWASLARFSTVSSLLSILSAGRSRPTSRRTSSTAAAGAGAPPTAAASEEEGEGAAAATAATLEKLLGFDWKPWKASLQKLMQADHQSAAQCLKDDERVRAETEKVKKNYQQLVSMRKTEERKLLVLREDLDAAAAQREQQQQRSAQEHQQLEQQLDELRCNVEGAHAAAQQQLQQAQQQLAARQQHDAQQLREGLTTLRQLQIDALDVKWRILHAFQELTQKKEDATAAQERALRKLLTGAESAAADIPELPPLP